MADEIPIYQTQDPAPRLMPLPTPDPRAYGTQIGDAISGLGATGMAAAHELDEHQTEIQAASSAADFAQFNADQMLALRKAQADGSADTGAAQEAWDQGASDLLSKYSDPKIAAQLKARLIEGRAQLSLAGETWDAHETGALIADKGQQAQNVSTGALASNPDPSMGQLQLSMKGGRDYWDNQAVPESTKLKGIREWDTAAISNHVAGLNENGMATLAQQQLDSGVWDPALDRDDRQRVANSIRVQMNTDAARAKAQDDLVKKAANQRLELLDARIKAGETPAEADWKQGDTDAATVGEPAKAYNFAVMRKQAELNQETQSATPAVLESTINALQAKGDKTTPDEQVELKQLQEILPKRKAAFDSDPGVWAAAQGHPRPDINMDTGEGFAALSQWRQSTQAAAGQWTPTLSKEQAAPLIERIRQGSATDRLKVAQWINTWGPEAPNVLQQLEPDKDSPFGQAVRLGGSDPETMRKAIIGADVDRKLPLFKPMKDDPNAPVDARGEPLSPEAILASTMGTALQLRGAPFMNAAITNAMNHYAATAVHDGFTQALHAAQLPISANHVLGGKRLATGEWAGGLGAVNGVNVLLPPSTTQRQFDQVRARADVSSYTAASGGRVPTWLDRPMTAAELQRAIPVSIGDGVYALRIGSNGWARGGKNQPYSFRYDLLAKQPGVARGPAAIAAPPPDAIGDMTARDRLGLPQ